MNHTKVFILIFAVSLLPPSSLFALDNGFSGNDAGRIYITGQYKPSIPQFSKFSIKEASNGVIVPKSLNKDVQDLTLYTLRLSDSFTLPYNPTYKKSLLGLGGVVGYAIGNFRVEFEAFYEKFNVNTPTGYYAGDNYQYFSVQSKVPGRHYIMKNTGITLSPALINVCYDISREQLGNVSPYLCFGFGVDLIDFLDKVSLKLSYQAKVGVSYSISKNLAFFIDGSFHGHLGNQFSDLLLDYPSYTASHDDLPFTSASAKLNINLMSTNIGIKFIF
ncbi:MAG: P44/Msp2 family outer membrane protein [Ehrlichia sp.]